jgi:hypothetical protein
MNNIAIIPLNKDKLDEATKMEVDVLEKWRKVLVERHLDTLKCMNNLTNMLGKQTRL